MNAFINVARRELVERKNVFIAALVAGFVPYLIQLLRASGGNNGADARDLTVVMLVGLIGPALAVLLGATIIARDLAERRLGFFFARPLSSNSLWFGKLVAALLTITIGTLLVCLPVAAVHGLKWAQSWELPTKQALQIFSLLLLGAFFAAHTISTFARSKSAWVVADVALLLVTVSVGFASFKMAVRTSSLQTLEWVTAAAVAAAFVTAISAGAWQLARGRTDRVASHRALSMALWGGLLLSAALLYGFMTWYVSADARDISLVAQFRTDSKNDWMYVEGRVAHRAPDYYPSFLFNRRDGRQVRGLSSFRDEVRIMPDGTAALVLVSEVTKAGPMQTLHTVDLTKRDPRLTATDIAGRDLAGMIVSPSFRRVAFHTHKALVVYDVPSGRLLASYPASSRTKSTFVDEDRLLTCTVAGEGVAALLRVAELNVAQKSSRVLVQLPAIYGDRRVLWSSLEPSTRRLLIASDPHDTAPSGMRATIVRLIDGSTGAVLFEKSIQSGRGVRPLFLPNGAVAYTVYDARDRSTLHIEQNGVTRSYPLPKDGVSIDRVLPDGRITLFRSYGDKNAMWDRSGEIAIFDPAKGSLVTPFVRGLRPLDRIYRFIEPDLAGAREAAFRPAIYGHAETGGVVAADLATGKLTPIIGGR